MMTMPYEYYVKALRQNWWVILLALAVAVGAALLRTALQTPQYRTDGTYIISPTELLLDSGDFLRGLNTLDQETITLTYVEIMVSERVRAAAAAELELDPLAQGEYRASAIQLPDSNVLRLSVTGPEPELVATVAAEIGQQAILFGQELYPIYKVQVLDSAQVPSDPFSPTPARDAILAAILGAGIGLLGAIFAQDLWQLLRTGVVESPMRGEGVETR